MAVQWAGVACGVHDANLEGVTCGERLACAAPGILAGCRGGRGPGAAVVQADLHDFVGSKCGAEGAAYGLRCRFGDEVGAAASRVGAKYLGRHRGGGRCGVECVTVAVGRAGKSGADDVCLHGASSVTLRRRGQ